MVGFIVMLSDLTEFSPRLEEKVFSSFFLPDESPDLPEAFSGAEE